MKRALLVGTLILASVLSPACRRESAADSEASRTAEARAYLKNMDLRAVVNELADQHAANWPDQSRDSFRAFVGREVRWSALEEGFVQALAKNFTAAEIRALTEFQNSAAGRALLKKLPAYQAEVMPPLQAEVQRVLTAGDFARTRIRWEFRFRELEAGPADETQTAEFPFSNEGTQPITLTSITTSCGCTTAALDKTVFRPGERGTIRTVFTKGDRTGEQLERVTITTDEPGKPSVKLELRITISDPLTIKPRLLIWKSSEPPSLKTVPLEVRPGQEIDILGIDSVPADFTAKAVLDKGNGIYLVHLTPRTTSRPTAGRFFVLASARPGKILRIPVYLRVLPPAAPPRGEDGLSWDDVLWVDAQSAAAFSLSHIPGALPLTEEAWDAQLVSLLARWTPGKRIVVYCQPPEQVIPIVRRLQAYGLKNLHVIGSGD
jgi:hypothetical protein